MTGPEHYQEAERLLAVNVGNRTDPSEPMVIASALVHATLAQAAAAALDAVRLGRPGGAWPYCEEDIEAWGRVAGTGRDDT
jgi:hypothetical protein